METPTGIHPEPTPTGVLETNQGGDSSGGMPQQEVASTADLHTINSNLMYMNNQNQQLMAQIQRLTEQQRIMGERLDIEETEDESVINDPLPVPDPEKDKQAKAAAALVVKPPIFEPKINGTFNVPKWIDKFKTYVGLCAPMHMRHGNSFLMFLDSFLDPSVKDWIDNHKDSLNLVNKGYANILDELSKKYADGHLYTTYLTAYHDMTLPVAGGSINMDMIQSFNEDFQEYIARIRTNAPTSDDYISYTQQLHDYMRKMPSCLTTLHLQYNRAIQDRVIVTDRVVTRYMNQADTEWRTYYGINRQAVTSVNIKPYRSFGPDTFSLARARAAATAPTRAPAPSATTTATNPSQFWKRAPQRQPPPPQPQGPTPMEIGNVDADAAESEEDEDAFIARVAATPLPKLTAAEKTRCRKLGLCFKCRQKGHIAQNCPTIKNQENSKAPPS